MIGDLRHRVTISYNDPTYGATGEVTDVWTDLDTVYARISPLSGTERLMAQQRGGELTHKMVVRHRYNFGQFTYTTGEFITFYNGDAWSPLSSNEPIAPKHRATYYNRTFEIIAVLDLDERHRYDEIWLKEIR